MSNERFVIKTTRRIKNIKKNSQNSRTVNTNDHRASVLFQDSEAQQMTTKKQKENEKRTAIRKRFKKEEI
jgi:hypothetical protein